VSDEVASSHRPHILGELGIALATGESTANGALAAVPEVCSANGRGVRTGVLCTMADIVAGRLAAQRTAPRLSVTVDMTFFLHAAPSGSAVVARARLLKSGRTTIVTETSFRDAHEPDVDADTVDPPFATCLTTFVASGRPGDVLPTTAAKRIPIMGTGVPSLDAPIIQRLGAMEREPGVLELELVPFVVNSAGMAQGGTVALLADAAAQSAGDAVSDGRGSVSDLDIRFLTGMRAGPVRTSATRLGPSDGVDSWWRIELRDVGNDQRVGAVAIARYTAR